MTAAAQEPLIITEPGVYDMPFDTYLADPVPDGSLSTSGAKTLLTGCPALFAYQRDHGTPTKPAFDFGHAAHTEILGDGIRIVVVDGPWTTTAAKRAVAEARESGATPLHAADAAKVRGMGEALRAHPTASRLLDLERGQVEQSGFWVDPESEVWRRFRFDYMRGDALIDFKTTDDLSDRALANVIARYGYDQQNAWYCDGAKALGLSSDPRFLFIFQAKTAPYLVRVIELPERWVEIGRDKNRRAVDLYAQCRAANEWPGYSPDIEVLMPPAWVEYEQEDMVI